MKARDLDGPVSLSAIEMRRAWLGWPGDPGGIPAHGWNQAEEPTDFEEAAVPPYRDTRDERQAA